MSTLNRTPASEVAATMVDLPVVFVENAGQWPDSILFRADAGRSCIWLTRNSVYHQFTRISSDDPAIPFDLRHQSDTPRLETHMLRKTFPGAQGAPRVSGEDPLAVRYNYFIGDDPAKWRTDVRAYRSVVLEDLYPGVDLKYYGFCGQIEYDFVADTGVDPAQIRVRYEGAQHVFINDLGDLVVETEWARITERHPLVYQSTGNGPVLVSAEYELINANTFGFTILGGASPRFSLVIDPVLDFCSYLGGSANDLASAVAADASGNVFVAGITSSADFPTQGPYQTDQTADDAFVIKLSADGQTLVYGTYLGGSSFDEAYGLAVDSKGDAYVVGVTESTNFPTVNAFQSDQPFPDGFVAKLNSQGNDLIYSTYLGGSSFDEVYGVAVDGNGYAVVAGGTSSSNFPTKNPFLSDQTGDDAFVTRMGQFGDSLVYSTYFGGNHIDAAYALTLDGSGNVYITGHTRSSDLPFVSPFQGYQANWDAYVAKISVAGDSVLYGTYLGGAAGDVGYGVAVDGAGQAYVTGVTSSSDFPIMMAYQADMPSDDAFLVKLNAAGSGPIYATYLGGSAADFGRDVAVDAGGHAYVVGWTLSADFPTVDAVQTARDTVDGFAVIFDATGMSLDYGTYLAGSGVDDARGVVVSANGDACIAGRTDSPNFLTQNPYQSDQGGRDAFVLMLEADPVGLSDDEAPRPGDFGAVDNYPNPFNLTTVVRFRLTRPQVVKLTVYNTLGERVSVLCDRVLPAGAQAIPWNGCNHQGIEMPSGTYLYRLEVDGALREGKMMLLK
jgi:hypothetical protein